MYLIPLFGIIQSLTRLTTRYIFMTCCASFLSFSPSSPCINTYIQTYLNHSVCTEKIGKCSLTNLYHTTTIYLEIFARVLAQQRDQLSAQIQGILHCFRNVFFIIINICRRDVTKRDLTK